MVASARSYTAAEKRPTPSTTQREGHTRPVGNPYSVREAAALLGVSQDAIEANYAQLEGFRIGRRILIPRPVVDRLVGASHEDGGNDEAEAPALERVLALLPHLAPDERVKVAQVALATQSG